MISQARKTMLREMMASVGAGGKLTTPRVASTRVILWATVKEVIALNTGHKPVTINNSGSTNSKWSAPPRIWVVPMRQ